MKKSSTSPLLTLGVMETHFLKAAGTLELSHDLSAKMFIFIFDDASLGWLTTVPPSSSPW